MQVMFRGQTLLEEESLSSLMSNSKEEQKQFLKLRRLFLCSFARRFYLSLLYETTPKKVVKY
jgi:hypothetical protein